MGFVRQSCKKWCFMLFWNKGEERLKFQSQFSEHYLFTTLIRLKFSPTKTQQSTAENFHKNHKKKPKARAIKLAITLPSAREKKRQCCQQSVCCCSSEKVHIKMKGPWPSRSTLWLSFLSQIYARLNCCWEVDKKNGGGINLKSFVSLRFMFAVKTFVLLLVNHILPGKIPSAVCFVCVYRN